MRFAWPIVFVLLALLPMVGIVHVWLRRRRSGAVRFSSLARAEMLKPSLRQRLRPLLLALRLACLALLIGAIARPQKGVSETRVSTEGVAIEMVVDRSGSMNETMGVRQGDPTKLEVTKRVFKDFVLGDGKALPGRPNDMIGLIAFAKFAETVCPLVRSRDAIVELVDQIATAQIRIEAGTAIGDGIALAAARLKNAEDEIRKRADLKKPEDFKIKSKAIILLTDGQNNAGTVSPEDAAKMAAQWGIKIYAIGIGGAGGRLMRMPDGSSRPMGGEGVDMGALEGIASIAGGRAWPAESPAALREAYAEIDRLERTNIESVEYTDYTEAFPPLAIGAGAALLLEIALAATILRRIP